MSKSMNKYHKRSESGMLPGWVKVGALAMGVGVGVGMGGVPVPGGGVSKVWAGKYRVSVCKSDAGTAIRVMDVEAGQADEISFASKDANDKMFYDFVVCKGNIVRKYKYGKDRFLFSLGDFNFVLTPRCALYISGGSSKDSLAIERGEVFVESLHEVVAAILALSDCERVENYGKVSTDVFSIDNCKNFVNGHLFAGLFVFSDVQIRNVLIKADEIVKPDGDISVLNPYQEDQPCELLKEGSGKRFVLKGFSDEFGGCFRKHGYLEDYWSPYGDVPLPFRDSDDIRAQKMVVAGKEDHYYRLPKAGVYRCVLFLSVIDGCGKSHEQDVLLTIKDSEQKVLTKCRKCFRESYNGKKPLPFPCVVELNDANLLVTFFVKALCKKGGMSLIKTDSVAYFQLVEDSLE